MYLGLGLTLANIQNSGAAPNAPTQNAVTNRTDVSFSVNWGAVSGATGYYVYLYQSDGTTLISKTDVGNVTTYSITGRTQNTTYKTAISAYNLIGEGAQSSQVSTLTFTTVAQTYFTTNSIIDATEKNAANQFVIDAYGLTGYLTPLQIDINTKLIQTLLISPTGISAGMADLKGFLNASAIGSPAYLNTGITGSIGNYITTNWIPSTMGGLLNSFGWTVASNTESAVDKYDGGVEDGSIECLFGIRRVANLLAQFINQGTATISITSLSSKGVHTFVRTASNLLSAYKDGTLLGTNTDVSTSLPTKAHHFLGYNASGSHVAGSGRQGTTFILHQGLTSNEVINLHDAVNRYNTNVILGGRL